MKLDEKRYPTLEKIVADIQPYNAPEMDPAECVKRNVDRLRDIRKGLNGIDQLRYITDVTDTSIDRAYQLYEDGERLIQEIEHLIHDLRDDYGTGYKLVKPKRD